MSEALQQGHADGMCGLYAVLNFLRRSPSWKGGLPQSDFWYVLDACRHLGWLTPQYLTEGLEDYQIKAILDHLISNYRMPLATYFTDDIQRLRKYRNFADLAKAVQGKEGSIIANLKRRYHWLLVTPGKGIMSVIDSASDTPVLKLKEDQKSLSIGGGVAILPKKLFAIEIDL